MMLQADVVSCLLQHWNDIFRWFGDLSQRVFLGVLSTVLWLCYCFWKRRWQSSFFCFDRLVFLPYVVVHWTSTCQHLKQCTCRTGTDHEGIRGVEQPRETKRWSYLKKEVMYISFKKLSLSKGTWPPMPYVDFQPWRSSYNYTAYVHETGLFSAVGDAMSPSVVCDFAFLLAGQTSFASSNYSRSVSSKNWWGNLSSPCLLILWHFRIGEIPSTYHQSQGLAKDHLRRLIKKRL